MHFHCTQCRHQFCSGCYNAFYAKNVSPEEGERDKRLWGAGRPATGIKGWRHWGATHRRGSHRDLKHPSLSPLPVYLLQTFQGFCLPHPYSPHAGVPENVGP